MKKVAALALSAGLVAGGCALMPHTGVKPNAGVGASGPVTVNLTNMPEVQQMLQAIATGKNDGGTAYGAAKMIEVRVFKGHGTDAAAEAGATAGMEVAKSPLDASKLLIATASIPTTGVATINLPAIPAGKHILAVRVFSDTTDHVDVSGNETANSNQFLIGESESYVNPVVGVPLSVTLPLYLTFKNDYIQTLNTSNATATIGYQGLSQPTTGLYLRLANWNPKGRMAAAGHTDLRVSIVAGSAYATTLASSSATNAGWWKVGHISSDLGYSATQSFNTDAANGGTDDSWNWTSDKKTIYTDIELDDVNGYNTDDYGSATVAETGSGSVSIYLPKALVPTNCKIYLTDIASGSSGAGSNVF